MSLELLEKVGQKGMKQNMKLLDKFLKKLNVNRNTFFTFILTLLTFYIAIDRIVEMLIMIFTGVAYSYWGPIKYTLALACPVFAFAFSGSSSYSDTRASKLALFHIFSIGFYVIVLSLFTQSLNMGAWLLFMSVPNYVEIVTEYSELIKPAFCALSIYLPLVTIYPFVKFILLKVDDTKTMVKSIWDFRGIDLSDKRAKHGPYACDIALFKDFDTSKKMSLPEERRFQSLLVCGGSGTGKTSMIFEPAIAQDIEKKYFFKEASKELGFTALKTGIATLPAPYSNDYLNQNFSLNMLAPAFGKEALFDTFLKKMIISSSPDNVYKDLGITYISPDYDTLSNMMSVCNNYELSYNIVDPSQPAKSMGLNPFVYEDPSKIAIIISSALQGLDTTEENGHKNVYREEIALQIIENLAILLKLIYPRMHDGVLPNLEDLLKLLTNFELVEKMCKILEREEDLAEQYEMQLSFFKRTFFSDAKGKDETEKNAYYISSRLENLLRAPSIRNILCNRHSNINFDESLHNGDITFVCTRRGDSGNTAHKAFGLFFLISMQSAVFRRPGNEKSRIPHFLYIDEFPDFLSKDTESMFTMYRKYRVATTISAQSISQFSPTSDKDNFNSVVLGNCGSKIYTGGSTPINELQWWSDEIGTWKQWSYKQDFDGKTGEMGTTLKEPKYDYTIKMQATRLQNMGQNRCGYKLLNDSGRADIGEGIMSYLSSKYKEKHPSKKYNFTRYATGTSGYTDDSDNNSGHNKKPKFNPKKIDFKDNNDEFNPIQNNDTKYSFEDEGSVVIDLKNSEN